MFDRVESTKLCDGKLNTNKSVFSFICNNTAVVT